ncbi:MAG: LysE family translocator [Chloroflexota bacterium]|nr:MAG: LysE family translocator [Chloroflexota bacterium]
MLAYLIQGIFLGFPAAATPGPLQAYFLSQTMRSGWRKTIPSAFAPLLSDGPIILLVLFFLTRTPDWLLRGLRIVGGLFILYLALNALILFRKQQEPETLVTESSGKGLFKAVVTNVLNPNPYIFWSLVAGPILIAAWRESSLYGAGFVVGFYGTLIGGFVALIIIFATAGRLSPRLVRALSGLSTLALIAFGIYQLWSGLSG